MSRRLLSLAACLSPLLMGLASPAPSAVVQLIPLAYAAPDSPAGAADLVTPACTSPAPVWTYAWYHCYTPFDIRTAYGVSEVGNPITDSGNLGQGQTIVLVDAYGSPTAKSDLQFFHNTFYPNLPNPNFDQVFPQGSPNFTNGCGPNGFSSGLSGPCAAANWSGEATLDIEWSYAIAPLAHIVLLAVPPAETEGVQGFPNLFNAIQMAINKYPAGTIFSQSFGVTEQTFGGAAATQTAKFDKVYQAAAAKGDTVLASSGDNGTTGASKQQKDSRTYSFPTDGWPASSPWVTAVGGTQLQYGWTWNPASDTPFLTDGSPNPDYFASTSGVKSEVVWNETWLPAASGGGPSAIYAAPAWQSSVAGLTGGRRGVPDLSWNAAVNGGVLVYITAFPSYQRSGWHVYGGTSAGSPQMGGVVALINKARHDANRNKGPIGFLSPHLYSLPSSDFHDIVQVTEGTAASGVLVNNKLWAYQADGSVAPGGIMGNAVMPGYDMATGFGTPNVSAFVAGLAAS
jgi:subtilase family serine protease